MGARRAERFLRGVGHVEEAVGVAMLAVDLQTRFRQRGDAAIVDHKENGLRRR